MKNLKVKLSDQFIIVFGDDFPYERMEENLFLKDIFEKQMKEGLFPEIGDTIIYPLDPSYEKNNEVPNRKQVYEIDDLIYVFNDDLELDFVRIYLEIGRR